MKAKFIYLFIISIIRQGSIKSMSKYLNFMSLQALYKLAPTFSSALPFAIPPWIFCVPVVFLHSWHPK
jgi:hypothetical protein